MFSSLRRVEDTSLTSWAVLFEAQGLGFRV